MKWKQSDDNCQQEKCLIFYFPDKTFLTGKGGKKIDSILLKGNVPQK